MALKKKIFKNNETVIMAEDMNAIQDAIIELENKISEAPTATGENGRKEEVALFADKWVGEASPYSQIVTIPGVTIYTQVDVTPTAAQFELMRGKELAFVAENVDGVVTIKATGQKPTNDYVLQVTLHEVNTTEVSA